MRKALAVCLSLLICSPSWAAVVLVANTIQGGNAPTTTGVDTTNATLLLVGESCFSISPCNAPTDSNGNTWNPITVQTGTSGGAEQMWYAWDHGGSPLSVGAGHTFSGDVNVYGIVVEAFSGTLTSGNPLDQQNGTRGNVVSSVQPGNVTPGQDNEVVITYCGAGAITTSSFSIDSGYAITDQMLFNPGVQYAMALAYLIQTTAGTTNPTWSFAAGNTVGASIATFKASAGGGVTATPIRTQLQNFYRGGILR